MTNSTGFSSEIYLSRDKIRNQIIDYMKEHLELENVDLTKSSFLSYMVNLLSTLTSNLLFYQSSVYREFFLTKAQLPESVFNLAAFLGYDVENASYATSNVLMTIPFGFSSNKVTFTIPESFRFYADDIEFRTYYKTEVAVTNNSSVKVTIHEDVEGDGGTYPKVYNIPVNIDTTANNEFSFLLPTRQMNVQTQEFQIDSDLKKFQFTSIDVPINGKLADLTVEVKPPDSVSWKTYEYFSSLYLMDPTTYGFTYQRTSDGITLFFGNGLMGIQPTPGSTVKVTTKITKGSDGNVIAGTIKNGDRIYITDAEETTILNYSITNAYPATGGKDEESLEEIRSNAIANIKSMGRLVSEDDYHNLNELQEKYLKNSTIINSVYPFLKRSDLKINEINMYLTTTYKGDLTKSKTIYSDLTDSDEYIPRGTRLEFDNENYVTLFDITIDDINKAAYYDYIIRSIEITPLLTRTYGTDYDLTANNLLVSKELDDIVFKLKYRTSEPDFDQSTAQIEIMETGDKYTMINDDSNTQFVSTISPYTKIPTGDLTYNFTITSPEGIVGTYSSEVMVRRDMRNIMQSDVISDGTSVIVYDIPTIPESYYDTLDLVSFETNILQELIKAFYTLDEYRMLTDFINMKFANTYGKMNGMLNNDPTEKSVLSFVNSEPVNPNTGDRYILNDTGNIITCTDSTSVVYFHYVPTTNDIVHVENKGQIYIFNGTKWVNPTYNIPLQLELEVFQKSGVSQTIPEMNSQIKTKLLDEFSNRFGTNISLYKSEITKAVQELDFVHNCNVLKPESDIFFSFFSNNMTQIELLEYVPDYVYFDEDSILIRIL